MHQVVQQQGEIVAVASTFEIVTAACDREIAAISSTLCSMSPLSASDDASADAVIAGCFDASEKWKICRIQKLTV